MLFFCVQVNGAQKMEVAKAIDPEYAKTLIQAINAGVEVFAWRARQAKTSTPAFIA